MCDWLSKEASVTYTEIVCASSPHLTPRDQIRSVSSCTTQQINIAN